jgi:hypothetical protein
MKFEKPVDMFVLFIILIKIVFILSSIGHVILSHLSKKNEKNGKEENVEKKEKEEKEDAKLVYWKERTEFIFVICMSLLLIYYFRPGHMKPIDRETSLLFFLFGWILIITAKWSDFFASAKWDTNISRA